MGRLPFQHGLEPEGFRLGQAAVELPHVAGVRESGGDIVEQHGEGTDAPVVKPCGLVEQDPHRFRGGKAEILAGVKAVDEVDIVPLGRVDEPAELAPLRLGVGQLPALAVVGVVLGRVEVGIHAAHGAEREHGRTVDHAPRGTEETLDDPPPLESPHGGRAVY